MGRDTATICVCCKSSDCSFRGRRKGFEVHACSGCGLEFVNPLPTPEELREFYSNDYLPKHVRERTEIVIRALDKDSRCPKRDWFDLVLETARREIRHRDLTILEVGSGLGGFVHYANRHGCPTVGTESSVEHARAVTEVIDGRVESIGDRGYAGSFGEETFDLIYLEHVFEHLPNPEEVLADLRLCMKPDGLIWISVPNHRSLLARTFGLRWGWTVPPAHLYYYNRNALCRLLESSGFTFVSAWSGDYSRSIHQFFSMKTIFNKAKALLNRVFNASFRPTPHRYTFATSFIDYLNLFPYGLLYPLIVLSHRFDMGSEMTLLCRKTRDPQ